MFDCDQEWIRKYREALDNQPLPRLFRYKELLRKMGREFRSAVRSVFVAWLQPAILKPAIPVPIPMKVPQSLPVAEPEQSAKAG
jgi:hypothetical protein